MNHLEEQAVQCPYCGETFTVLVDCSITEQSYIEDCQVCCQAILMDVTIDADTISILTRRDDE